MDNFIQKYNEADSGHEDIINELVIKTYFALFEENKTEKKADNRIPSIKQIFTKADYDFDTGCYDVIYQVDKKQLTEENIMLLLQKNGCVYRFGAFVCCDAQLEMFDENEMLGENEGWYLGAGDR